MGPAVIIPRVLLEYEGLGMREKIAFAELISLERRVEPGEALDVFYPTLAARMGCCTLQARHRLFNLQGAGLIEITRDDYSAGYRILSTPIAEACRAGP